MIGYSYRDYCMEYMPPSPTEASAHDLTVAKRVCTSITSSNTTHHGTIRLMAVASHERLPAELITEIFLFYLARSPAYTFPLPCKGRRDPRLILPQVCSTWRKVAFNTPQLWATGFRPSRRWGHESHNQVELANAWLSQCTSSCLSLQKSAGIPGHVDLIDKVLVPNASRVRELVLDVGLWEITQELTALNTAAGALTALTDLKITMAVDVIDESNDPITSFGRSHLAHAKAYLSSFDPLSLELPWAQLRTLRLVNFTIPVDVCIALLTQCTSLVDCYINAVSDDNNLALPSEPLCLPHLKHLEVDFHHSDDRTHFLSALSLPNLRSCHLRCPRNFVLSEYAPFLDASPSLGALILERPHSVLPLVADLDDLLTHTPELRKLRLNTGEPLPAATLTQIARGELLPSLESLSGATQHLEALISAVRTRQTQAIRPIYALRSSPPTPLRSVTVAPGGWTDAHLLPEFMGLAKQFSGLSVAVR